MSRSRLSSSGRENGHSCEGDASHLRTFWRYYSGSGGAANTPSDVPESMYGYTFKKYFQQKIRVSAPSRGIESRLHAMKLRHEEQSEDGRNALHCVRSLLSLAFLRFPTVKRVECRERFTKRISSHVQFL